MPKTKSFTAFLDETLEKRLEERLEIIKEFTGSISRKKWVLEAFLEKIDTERDLVKKFLDSSVHLFKKKNNS